MVRFDVCGFVNSPPIVVLDVKFLDSLDWQKIRRLANHYNLNIRGD
jgi:hypothetical protein